MALLLDTSLRTQWLGTSLHIELHVNSGAILQAAVVCLKRGDSENRYSFEDSETSVCWEPCKHI